MNGKNPERHRLPTQTEEEIKIQNRPITHKGIELVIKNFPQRQIQQQMTPLVKIIPPKV